MTKQIFTLLMLCTFCACALHAPAQQAWHLMPEVPMVLEIMGEPFVPLAPFAELTGSTMQDNIQTGEFHFSHLQNRLTVRISGKVGQTTLRVENDNDAAIDVMPAPFRLAGILHVPLRALVSAFHGTATLREWPLAKIVTLPVINQTFELPIASINARGADTAHLRDYDTELFVLNPATMHLRRITYNDWHDSLPLFTADGTSLLTARGNTLVIRQTNRPYFSTIALPTGNEWRRVTPAGISAQWAILYSQTVTKEDDWEETIHVLHPRTRETINLGPGAMPVFSPDTSKVAFSMLTREKGEAISMIGMINSNGAGREYLMEGEAPQFSPNGTFLLARRLQFSNLFLTPRWRLRSYRLQDGKIAEMPLNASTIAPMEACISPDNRQIAVAQDDGLWLWSTDFTEMRQLTKLAGDRNPVWSADGTALYFLRSDRLQALNITDGKLNPLLPDARIQQLMLAPDGTHLLLSSWPQPE